MIEYNLDFHPQIIIVLDCEILGVGTMSYLVLLLSAFHGVGAE